MYNTFAVSLLTSMFGLLNYSLQEQKMAVIVREMFFLIFTAFNDNIKINEDVDR